jgi:DNA-binding transcriptional ArsR family regulator
MKIKIPEREQLYDIIKTVTNKPDFLAIELYLKILHEFQEKASKKHNWEINICYHDLESHFNFVHDTIRRHLIRLEKLGLIKRELRTEEINGLFRARTMYIKILKNKLIELPKNG